MCKYVRIYKYATCRNYLVCNAEYAMKCGVYEKNKHAEICPKVRQISTDMQICVRIEVCGYLAI